jgi:hypothetical protein
MRSVLPVPVLTALTWEATHGESKAARGGASFNLGGGA